MNVIVVKKRSFHVVGVPLPHPEPEMGIQPYLEMLEQRIGDIPHPIAPSVAYGVFFDNHDPSRPSFIGVEASDLYDIPPGMVGHTFQPHYFAVLTHKGPMSEAHVTYGKLARWVRRSPAYRFLGSFGIEVFDHRFYGPDHPASEFDLYFPVLPLRVGVLEK